MNELQTMHKRGFAGSVFIVKMNRGRPLIKVGGGYITLEEYTAKLIVKLKRISGDNQDDSKNVKHMANIFRYYLKKNFSNDDTNKAEESNQFITARLNESKKKENTPIKNRKKYEMQVDDKFSMRFRRYKEKKKTEILKKSKFK